MRVLLIFAITTSAPRLALADATSDLLALTAPTSDGGTTITAAEAQSFTAGVSSYGADEAIRAIVAAGAVRPQCQSSQVYTAILRQLRYRVAGLAVSLNQAPGISFKQAGPPGNIEVTFDAKGVSYTRVDIVYTWDWWATTRAATLAPGSPGVLGATLAGTPAEGSFVYALHLFGSDGRDFWLNNGRDLGVFGGKLHYDHSLFIGAMAASPAAPSLPTMAALVRAFTHPASPGGAQVVGHETNLVVEELTWEGSSGVNDPALLNPALAELQKMQSEGVSFAPGVMSGMVSFISSMRWQEATYPGARFSRGQTGQLRLTPLDPRVVWMRVYYSTDGWNTPHVVECAAGGGPPVCALGHIPPGALLAYAVDLRLEDGQVRQQRVLDPSGQARNFFHAVP